MATNISTSVADAERIMVAKARFTQEHSMPTVALFERFTLKQGEKSITVPKVAQMTAQNLTDGVDLISSEDIGMTTTSLTASEVGIKVYLTYKLIREFNESAFNLVGRQMGDAMGRKLDNDGIALFTGFSTTFGADNKNFSFDNLTACIATAKALKFPSPINAIHHPNAVFAIFDSLVVTPNVSTPSPIPTGPTNHGLQDFYKWSFNNTNIWEDGNIEKDGATDSGFGAIFGGGALAYVVEQSFTKESDKDISMRAHEIVVTSDYGVFELDDAYGAQLHYEIGNAVTTT